MNKEVIHKEGIIVRPFEARLISEELRKRVQFFKAILDQERKIKSIKNSGNKY